MCSSDLAVLDADKEGFLRSAGSLIQTIGRAARNVNGKAILYADRHTDSMKRAMEETARRRQIQREYNEEHGITPESIVKPVDMVLARISDADYVTPPAESEEEIALLSVEQRNSLIDELEKKMREAAKSFEFEKAAQYRDRIKALKAPNPYAKDDASRSGNLGTAG